MRAAEALSWEGLCSVLKWSQTSADLRTVLKWSRALGGRIFLQIGKKSARAHWTERLNLIWKLFLMISCLDMIFFHTTGLLRHQGFQENWKKANKGRKGRTKGQRAKNVKSLDFLVVYGLFGVNNALISIFSIFKAIKAKKAAIVAGKAKLQMRKFI